MSSTPLRPLLCLCILALLLPALPCASAEQYAYVINPDPADRLNLRMEPSADADTLGKYYTGTRVKLLGEQENGYVFVNVSPMDGYMDADYLSDTPVVSAQPWLKVQNSGGTGVNIRRQPASDADILTFAPNGERIAVLAVRSDNWLHVRYGNVQGFASAALLFPELDFHSTYSAAPIATVPPELVPQPAPTPSPASSWTAAPTAAPKSNLRIVFSPGSSIVHLRERPQADAPSLGFVINGTQVELLKELENGWCIVLDGELTGYLPASVLDEIS